MDKGVKRKANFNNVKIIIVFVISAVIFMSRVETVHGEGDSGDIFPLLYLISDDGYDDMSVTAYSPIIIYEHDNKKYGITNPEIFDGNADIYCICNSDALYCNDLYEMVSNNAYTVGSMSEFENKVSDKGSYALIDMDDILEETGILPLKLEAAKKGKEVTAYYYDHKSGIKFKTVKIEECREAENGLYELALSEESKSSIEDAVLPCVLVDEGKIVGFSYCDELVFYTEIAMDDTTEPVPENKSDYTAVIVIGAVISAVMVCVIIILLKKRKAGNPAALVLHGRGGVMNGCSYPIVRNEVTAIGRESDNTICFPQDEPGISRHHCQLYWDNGRLMLRDMSSQGTYVNGARQVPDVPSEVKAGDIVYLADKRNSFVILQEVAR